MELPVDQDRVQQQIDELAAVSEAPPPVVTRILFSDADLEARALIKNLCRQLGLSLREDAVGNLFARWQGTDPGLAPMATGSHIDAIPNAGRYDGVVGVLGALEAIHALQQSGFVPNRSIELIVFTAEEPTRFGIGCLGSRLMSGALSVERARALADSDGRSLDQVRTAAGFAGALDDAVLPGGYYEAFLEMHVEQGPVLEQRNLSVGVV